jgi:hypothetical protein
MKIIMKNPWLFSLTLAATLSGGNVFAAEPGAHVHGGALLQVVHIGNTVTINLESPLDNLLGFEHAPRTDKQKQKAQAMADLLRQPEALFVLTPAAQCKPSPVQLTAPVLNLGVAEKNAQSKNKARDGHAELEAELIFTCGTPAALKDLEVKLFDAFRGIRQLDAQLVGPRGQSAAKLTSKKRRLAW